MDSSGNFSFSALQRQLGVPESAPKALDSQANHTEELYDQPLFSEHSGRAITGMSFTTIMAGDHNKKSSDYIMRHEAFIRTKACWFQVGPIYRTFSVAIYICHNRDIRLSTHSRSVTGIQGIMA